MYVTNKSVDHKGLDNGKNMLQYKPCFIYLKRILTLSNKHITILL